MADDKKHAEIDAALVRQLAEILNETDLTEVEVERGELRIRVAREVTINAAPVQYAAAPAPVAAAPLPLPLLRRPPCRRTPPPSSPAPAKK